MLKRIFVWTGILLASHVSPASMRSSSLMGCCISRVLFSLRFALLAGLVTLAAGCSDREPASLNGAKTASEGAAGTSTPSDTPEEVPIVKDPIPAPASDFAFGPVPRSAPALDRTPAPADSSASDGGDIPPLLYMCPCDPRIVEDAPGVCPACGEALRPVRITLAYSCLGNTAFIQNTPGKCRTDGTDLVPISASMFWVCPGAPGNRLLDPGTCADGRDRIRRLDPLPHGDHNPRHSGQFFMASDAWHHLEGTYPSPGLFRVYFYDDWTKPIALVGFSGRLIVTDEARNELRTIPLESSEISNAMEARIPDRSLPLIASLRVRFKPGEPENPFDFRFTSYSQEPVRRLVTENRVESAPSPPPPRPVDEPSLQTAVTIIPQSASIGPPPEDPIPPTLEEILAEFKTVSEQLAADIENNVPLGQLWFRAIRTKNLALGIVSDHLSELPPDQRVVAEDAANRLVRTAFAIDEFGDRGDRQAILSAYEIFAAAVEDIRAAYATVR